MTKFSIFLVLVIVLLLAVIYQHFLDEDEAAIVPTDDGWRRRMGASKYYDRKDFPFVIFLDEGASMRPVDFMAAGTQVIQHMNKITNFEFFHPTIYRSKFEIPSAMVDLKRLPVNFVRRHHLDHEAFDGSGKVMAHAYLPPFRALCFDMDEPWVNYKAIFSVFYHELGHVLGLDHNTTSRPKSIMYPSLVVDSKFEKKDLDALRELYPFIG